MKVRITPTIFDEYASRCPDHIPEKIDGAGTFELTAEEAKAVLDDALYNSNPQAFSIGPDDMPLPVYNAYRALAKQLRATMASGV